MNELEKELLKRIKLLKECYSLAPRRKGKPRVNKQHCDVTIDLIKLYLLDIEKIIDSGIYFTAKQLGQCLECAEMLAEVRNTFLYPDPIQELQNAMFEETE